SCVTARPGPGTAASVVPTDPLIVPASLTSSSLVEGAGDPPRMLSIGFIEQGPRALLADDRRTGDDRGPPPPRRQQLGGADLDGVDDCDGRERGARADRRVEPLDRDERVRLGGAQ